MTDHNLTPEIYGDFGLHLENMKRGKTMSRAISQLTIRAIQQLGFKVYMQTENKRVPSWLVYTSCDRIGYLQTGGRFGGFDVSTEHKPCKNSGSGFRVANSVELTRENLLRGFTRPSWASGLNVTQWESPKEFFESSPYNKQYKRVFYTVSNGTQLVFNRDYMGAIGDALAMARDNNTPWESVSVYDEEGFFYDWIKAADQLFNTSMGM